MCVRPVYCYDRLIAVSFSTGDLVLKIGTDGKEMKEVLNIVGEAVFAVTEYTGKFRPKGVSFLGVRYVEG